MINDAAYNEELSGFTAKLVESVKKAIEKCIPCEVTEINAERTKVSIKPLIKILGRDGSETPREEIKGLTVFNAGAGGMLISFQISVGDLGWIEASDRDISLFLQSYTDSKPATGRKHSFSDARFIPDIMRNFTIAAEDSAALVIQNKTGSVKIALDQSEIRIKNDSASIVVSGSSVTGVAPGGFDLNGFTIAADGTAFSPVSVTAPLVSGTTSISSPSMSSSASVTNITGSLQKNSVEIADENHTHNPGTFAAGGDNVTGTSAASNG